MRPDSPRRGHELRVTQPPVERAAAEQFRAAIALAPHAIASFHYRLGLALLAGGDGPGARIELERALELDPSFAEAEDARRLLSELSAGSAVARPTS